MLTKLYKFLQSCAQAEIFNLSQSFGKMIQLITTVAQNCASLSKRDAFIAITGLVRPRLQLICTRYAPRIALQPPIQAAAAFQVQGAIAGTASNVYF